MGSKGKRIAIKIGSNVISRKDGKLNLAQMAHLVDQMTTLMQQGHEVVLISSGAVAAGRGEFKPVKKTDIVIYKQICSAIGQVRLMNRYYDYFGTYDVQCAQVLTTKESFADRQHYLNMKSSMNAMLEQGILPIVNENDTIAITELMFTDNDELAGLMATMLDCDSLLLLSNIDGIFDGHPEDAESRVIPEVDEQDLSPFIQSEGSSLGRGGMQSKISTAKKTADQGIDVFIANGTRQDIITDLINGKENTISTHFVPSEKKSKSIKKWLAHSKSFVKGRVIINQGARDALLNEHQANSLLCVGITAIEGAFQKADLVEIFTEDGDLIGLGKAQYESEKLKPMLGSPQKKPFIHYDYLHLETNS